MMREWELRENRKEKRREKQTCEKGRKKINI